MPHRTIKFLPAFHSLILLGQKTQTRRRECNFIDGEVVHIEDSHINIHILSIREHDLQNITIEDVKKEGLYTLETFKDLWNTLHPELNWDMNPRVYVLDFEVTSK